VNPWHDLHAKFHLNQLILSHLGSKKTRNFTIFWNTVFCNVAKWQHTKKVKVECACTTTNLPLSNSIKIISILKQLRGKIMCTHSYSKAPWINTQTNKKLNIFGRTNIGTAIDNFHHLPAPLKHLWIGCTVLPPIFKWKGDPIECGSCRGMKLLEHVMKVVGNIFKASLNTEFHGSRLT